MPIETRNSGRRISGQKSSQGGRGNPEKASPAALERYIKGIHFPASKEDLIDQAKRNGAPQDVMYVLNCFSDQDYHAIWDIARETGIVERGEGHSSRQYDNDPEEGYDASEGMEESEEEYPRRGASRSRQQSHAGSRSFEHVSPVAVERSLKGIHFPASKQDLLEEARNNRASQEIIRFLNRFRDQDYHSVWQVAQEVGRLDRAEF